MILFASAITWIVERYKNKVLDVCIVSVQHMTHDALRVRFQLFVIILHGTGRIEDQRQATVHVFWICYVGVVSRYQAAYDQRNQPIHRFNNINIIKSGTLYLDG